MTKARGSKIGAQCEICKSRFPNSLKRLPTGVRSEWSRPLPPLYARLGGAVKNTLVREEKPAGLPKKIPQNPYPDENPQMAHIFADVLMGSTPLHDLRDLSPVDHFPLPEEPAKRYPR